MPPPEPTPEPRSVVVRHAAELLRELAAAAAAVGPVRVADAAGGLTCLILVWPAGVVMPTALGERPSPAAAAGREQCREDILAAVRAAGRALTRKEVIRALKAAGGDHRAGTVAKALADLTRSKRLVNLKDKRGYRLPGWVRKHPGLFDEPGPSRNASGRPADGPA